MTHSTSADELNMANSPYLGELAQELADRLERYSRYRDCGQDDDMDKAFGSIIRFIAAYTKERELALLERLGQRIRADMFTVEGEFNTDRFLALSAIQKEKEAL